MTTLQRLSKAVATGNRKEAKALTIQALEEGMRPSDLVDHALVPAMAEVGEKFKNDEIFVPEMLIAARAMKESMTVLEPVLLAAGITPKYTALIGTVEGDLHDIGKNLVSVMWKGANVNVIDLGTNVPPERFVQAIREYKPQVVGLSALLTTTMPAMATTVRTIRASDAPPVKIVVGGAPINQQYADEIGADGYSADAGAAVDLILGLLGGH
jgi:5-methyltetrahydrofolate--homocysteine methyltransferase